MLPRSSSRRRSRSPFLLKSPTAYRPTAAAAAAATKRHLPRSTSLTPLRRQSVAGCRTNRSGDSFVALNRLTMGSLLSPSFHLQAWRNVTGKSVGQSAKFYARYRCTRLDEWMSAHHPREGDSLRRRSPSSCFSFFMTAALSSFLTAAPAASSAALPAFPDSTLTSNVTSARARAERRDSSDGSDDGLRKEAPRANGGNRKRAGEKDAGLTVICHRVPRCLGDSDCPLHRPR